MQILRRAALAILWLLAGVGALCAAVWGATATGSIQPLVVVSGSMEPEIMTGDLIIAKKTPADSLAVGDVVSLPSQLTEQLVTHRIEAIEAAPGGGYTVTLKGDNNEFSDALDYPVSGDVWTPALQLPGWGNAIIHLTTPAVAVPFLFGLIGLAGLNVLIPASAQRTHSSASADRQRPRAHRLST